MAVSVRSKLNIIYLVAMFFLLLQGPNLLRLIQIETGMLILVNALVIDPINPATETINRVEYWLQRGMRGGCQGAYRGLGFVYWYRGQDILAFDEWQNAGFSADDFIMFGKRYAYTLEALRWYKLAEYLEPNNQYLWLQVGKTCQSYSDAGDICRRFVGYNSGNRLVDSAFSFDGQAWHFNRLEGGTYQIGECPDFPEKRCAILKIDNVVPERSVSWHQCMKVQPGQEYTFSAWIKVEDFGDVRWRLLYYQGAIDGKLWGRSAGNRSGEADWHYEEYSFIVPEFDENLACFHPVLLEGRGQIWFHSATLVEH